MTGKVPFSLVKNRKKKTYNVILSKIESNFVCASLFYIFELVVDEMYVEALVDVIFTVVICTKSRVTV